MAFAEPPDHGEIRATLALSQTEARTGSSRTLNLPGGRRVMVPIPAGIQDGQEIRLAGQGEPMWEGGPVGDLILTVSIAPTLLPGQSTPEFNESFPTEFTPLQSYPPTTSAPNNPPVGGAPYTSYPSAPQPEYMGAPSTGPYPDYGSRDQMYLPQNQGQNVYQAPPPYQSNPSYPGFGQLGQTGQQSYPPPTPRRRGPSPAIVSLIIILVLILLVGSGLIYYFGVYHPNALHDQATATAQAQLTATANTQASAIAAETATANAQASATANAQATVNAQASATATALQTILTTAISGTPTLSDSLSAQTSNNWDVLLPADSTVSGSCQFISGAYHSIMPTKGYFQPCYAEAPTFNNFAFQVQMTITKGDEGGILFRADPNNSKFYLLRIATDGEYDLFLYKNSQASSSQRLLSNTALNFKTGLNQTNTISLVAKGSNLYFYINNQYLDSANNGTFTSGKIGVFGESSTNATDVSFANAEVWKL